MNNKYDVAHALEQLGIEIVEERDEWFDTICPIHYETKPSFAVHIETGNWVCRHGDDKGTLFDLVIRLKHTDFADTLTWLDRLSTSGYYPEAHEDLMRALLPREKPSEGLAFQRWAKNYGELNPNIMSEYWFARGFSKATMYRFGVRYSNQIEESLVWPVHDRSGRVVGFTARYIHADRNPRYQYSPGFVRTLYPLNMLGGAYEVVLVEGPLDAMWLWQHDILALAMLGADLTSRQLTSLLGEVKRVTLALDNDAVGERVTRSLVKRLAEFDVRVASVSEVDSEVKDVQELDEKQLRLLFEHHTQSSVDWLANRV